MMGDIKQATCKRTDPFIHGLKKKKKKKRPTYAHKVNNDGTGT